MNIIRIQWDTKIHGAAVSLIAVNPRTVLLNSFVPSQGTCTEWDLTDGDDTPYGTLRTNANGHRDSDLAIHKRMARVARNYWQQH